VGNEMKLVNPGEVLHKDREDIEELKQLEEELGKFNFAAQYMQEPVSNSSSLLKKEDITFYTELKELEYIVQSWDTAIKVSSLADYTVCTTWGIKENRYYLIDMLREKYEYSDLKRAVIKHSDKYNPKFIIIEDKATGQSLIQDLAIETEIHIKKYKPRNDKITRFAATIPFFESGRILLPENSSWMNVFLQELMAFPNSKNDDVIDSLSQFVDVIKNYKNMVARIRRL
ncbi:MAG: hypothetical protein K0R02_1255, partial [Rickettsiaceae bacterium]|nr:hypothetical protein [Rickettsiaceae bacterium]